MSEAPAPTCQVHRLEDRRLPRSIVPDYDIHAGSGSELDMFEDPQIIDGQSGYAHSNRSDKSVDEKEGAARPLDPEILSRCSNRHCHNRIGITTYRHSFPSFSVNRLLEFESMTAICTWSPSSTLNTSNR